MTTFEFISKNAASIPNKSAIILYDNQSNKIKFTYQRLHQDIIKLTNYLAETISPETIVGISINDPYLHLLCTLACENLHCTTISFHPEENIDNLSFNFINFFISNTESNLPNVVLINHIIYQNIQKSIFKAKIYSTKYKWVLRLTRSSGSTGTPKIIPITNDLFDYWVHDVTFYDAFNSNSKFLATVPFTSNSNYCRIILCLRSGATVIFGNTLQVLQVCDVTHICFLPRPLMDFIKSLPKNWVKPKNLKVITSGGFLSKKLRSLSQEKLSYEIINIYGTNEVGGIAILDENGRGKLQKNVSIKITDGQHQEIKLGEVGTIAVNSPAMVNNYFDRSNSDQFKDKWFYPGDYGRLVDHKTIEVLGRSDEILNFGGYKESSIALRENLLNIRNIDDLAIFSINKNDDSKICIAFTCADCNLSNIQEQIKLFISNLNPRFTSNNWIIFKVNSLPKTSNKKINYLKLREIVLMNKY